MVIRTGGGKPGHSRRGYLTIELVVAMGILTAVMIPLGYSFSAEQKLCRAYYFQAIAMEIIDGEMEVLKAGQWRDFPEGMQSYKVEAAAARNLPPGSFVLSVGPSVLRLEWIPQKKGKGGTVWREIKLTALEKDE
jgi:hypothetical protein